MTSAAELASLLRVVASLVVVIAVAALVARLARRAGAGQGGTGLRVLERVGVSREAAVTVVEVAGQVLVLGVTAQRISLLCVLEGDRVAVAGAVDADQLGPGEPIPVPPVPAGPVPQQRRRAHAGGRGPGRARGGDRAGMSGAVLDPRTWQQGLDALRELTVRR